MFGILFTLFDLLGMARFDIIMESEKQKSRYNAAQKGNDTYIDNRGRMWLIQPGGKDIQCFETLNIENHHRVLRSTKNPSIILKDLTAIQEQEEVAKLKQEYAEKRKEALEKGEPYFYIEYKEYNRNGGVTRHRVCFKTDSEVCYKLREEQYKYKGCGTIYDCYIYEYEFDFDKKEKKKISSRRISKGEYEMFGGYTATIDRY